MIRKSAELLIGGSVTCGGTILGVVGLREQIDKLLPLPSYIYNSLLVLGIALLLFALISMVLSMGSRVNVRRWNTIQYICARVEKNQIEDMYSFCQLTLGENIATIERVRQWYEKNPDTLHIIYEHKYRPLN